MKRKTIHILVAALLLIGSNALFAQVARPAGTYGWFGKTISVDRSRQLYVGLNASMWVFYDLPNAILYQAWQGGATGGAYVTGAPQTVTQEYWFWNGTPQFPHVYRTSGTNYFKDSVSEYFASYTKPADITTHYTKWPKQPLNATWGGPYRSWSVLNNSANVGAKVRFRGYTVSTTNIFALKFGLILPGGGEISVTESPEYSNQPSGNHLVRTFTFSGIPSGYQVRLEHMGGTNAAAWSVTSGSATIQSGGMVQTADGQTILNGSF